jgi:hypothetical protein
VDDKPFNPLRGYLQRGSLERDNELKWISESAKDVGAVLRDYRNYIHPHKEFSHGVNLSAADAAVLWGVTKSISHQLL